MKKHTVYLAGPISGLTEAEALGWREDARIELAKYDVEGLSPMRDPQHVFSENVVDGRYDQVSLRVQRAIFMRDHNDCKKSDVNLINLLGAKKVSTGTVMEIAWAYAYGVPIVAIMEPEGNPHEHCMLLEACPVIVHNLEDAIEVTLSILLPDPPSSRK